MMALSVTTDTMPSVAPTALDAKSLTKQISAHAKAAQWQEAVALLCHGVTQSLQVDRVLLGVSISACHRALQWQTGLALLMSSGRSQRLADVVAYNMVIGSCQHPGVWEWPLQLLELLQSAGHHTEVFSLSRAIGSCRLSAQWSWVLQLWTEATLARCEADEEIQNSVLSAYETASCWHDAAEMLLHHDVVPREKDYAIGLRATAKAGKSEWVLMLMKNLQSQRLQANLRMYTASLAGCVEGQDWQSALDLWREAENTKVSFDAKSYEVALCACEVGKQWPWAIHLLEHWPEDGPDIFYYNKVLASCSSGAWQMALHLASCSLERGMLQLNVVSYRQVMNACASAEAWVMAIELLRLAPTDTPLRCLAQRAVGESRPKAALQLLRLARQGRCQEVAAFHAAMTACQASWHVVLAMFDEMTLAALTPDSVSFLALIDALQQGPNKWMLPQTFREAEALGIEMLPKAYKLSIRACAEVAQWQQALSFLQDAEARFGSMDAGTLSSIFTYSWPHALQLLSLLQARHTTPDDWLQRQAVKTLHDADKDMEALKFQLGWATWQGALNILAQHDVSWELAIDLLQVDLGAFPLSSDSDQTSSAMVALRFCASCHAWPMALHLLDAARYGDGDALANDEVVLSVALQACEDAMEWPQALALLSDLRRTGRRVPLFTSNEEFFDQMF